MTNTKKSAAPSLQRGMAVLEYLATHQRGATISEITEQLEFPSASVFRITQELTELGYLSRDPVTKCFALTNKFLRLGQPRGQSRGLVEASLAGMRDLHTSTGETTQLCCRVGTEVVVLEQLESIHPFKYSAMIGAQCPVYSCAPGKAIIAGLPEDERDELLRRIRFKRFTANTITDRHAFRKEMSLISECGYALDRAEGLDGIHCIASAIHDRNRYPVGAVTIAAPASRIPPSEFSRLGSLVAKAAQASEAIYGQ